MPSAPNEEPAGVSWSGGLLLVCVTAVVNFDVVYRPSGHADLAGLVKTTVFAGIAAMVLIDTVKRLFPLRAVFQSRLVRRRLKRYAEDITRRTEGRPISEAEALGAGIDRLIQGLGRGSVSSVFNLPVEQMIPQLADALSFVYLGEGRSGPDLRTLLFADMRRGPLADADDYAVPREPHDLDLVVERNSARFLEQLQVEIGNRWRHYLRSAAVGVSGLIGLTVAYWAPADVAVSPATPIAALLGSGFIAWLARDVTAAVERWRR